MDLTIDVIVMFAMFHFFHKNRTGFKAWCSYLWSFSGYLWLIPKPCRTQGLMNRLAMYTFASGSITVIANAVILAMVSEAA
jgi:hypothetical protein